MKFIRIIVIIFIVLIMTFDVFANTKPCYCPKANTLTKTVLHWKSGNIWISRQRSFANKIDKFIGAQWIGVNIGQIVCLYKGDNSFTFPVILQTIHPVLIRKPHSRHWFKTKRGYKECFSSNVKDCKFYQKNLHTAVDPYKQIGYKLNNRS